MKRREEKALSLLGAARDFLLTEAAENIVDHILQTGELYPPIRYVEYWDQLGEPDYSIDTAYLNLGRCKRMDGLQKVFSSTFKDALKDVGMVDEVVHDVLKAVAQRQQGFVTFKDAWEKREQQPPSPIWPTAMDGLFDLMQGLRRGQVYLIAGDPGAGKSTLSLQMAYDVAAAGGRVAIYSIDMGLDRTVEILDQCGHDHDIPITLTDSPTSVAEFLSHSFHYRVTGVDLIIVDQLQQLHSAAENLEQRVTQAAAAMAEVARRCNCVVWGCSRVNRQAEGPSLGGIYGAHNVGHEVAGLMWLTKRLDGKVQFHVVKNRFARVPSGPVNLSVSDTGLFSLGDVHGY